MAAEYLWLYFPEFSAAAKTAASSAPVLCDCSSVFHMKKCILLAAWCAAVILSLDVRAQAM
ncbi:MAG TPA: hypothetical protein VL051_10650, partial [Burkholderiaceae bacterium]|nr:hypothetical protein [Burkholderiaceae bacterium]